MRNRVDPVEYESKSQMADWIDKSRKGSEHFWTRNLFNRVDKD